MNIKKRDAGILFTAAVILLSGDLYGQSNSIHSLQKIFRISWVSSSLNISCHVQRAESPAGPWSTLESTWATTPSNHTDTVMSNSAMFHKVLYDIPDPHFADITPEQTLALITHRQSDPQFTVIDVRRASEYNTRHITDALNYDYYQTSNFSAQLDALDKNKVYLIYCRSGSRSGNAHDIMLGKGFHEVYNMLSGMNAFVDVPGADAILIP